MSRKKSKRRGLKKLRVLVFTRDGHKCRFCGRGSPDVELHVDHIIPVAAGGDDELENLQTLCKDCNLGKSDAFLVDEVQERERQKQEKERREREDQERKRKERERQEQERLQQLAREQRQLEIQRENEREATEAITITCGVVCAIGIVIALFATGIAQKIIIACYHFWQYVLQRTCFRI